MKLTKRGSCMDFKEADKLSSEVLKAFVEVYGMKEGYARALGFFKTHASFLIAGGEDRQENTIEAYRSTLQKLLFKIMTKED
jgi:hypothetical protein